jgi:hypothetical protein
LDGDLGISTNTVRNTLARLFEKVGVSTRSELMGALAADDPERMGEPGTRLPGSPRDGRDP